MLTYSKGSVGRSPAAMPNLQKKEKGAASTIQTKLTVGKPNDRYEREADQVADQVVKQTTGTGDKVQNQAKVALQTSLDPQVQRMNEEEEVQAKSNNNSQPVASAAVTAGIRSSEGSGSPLPGRVQTDMESGIGADFSKVRIHTDTRAQQMSADLNAQAFTVGNNVYFNKGKYNPESQSGKHLLAHELTHTVQQGAALQKQIQKQDNEEEVKPPKKVGPLLLDKKKSEDGLKKGAELTWPLEGSAITPGLEFMRDKEPGTLIPKIDPNEKDKLLKKGKIDQLMFFLRGEHDLLGGG